MNLLKNTSHYSLYCLLLLIGLLYSCQDPVTLDGQENGGGTDATLKKVQDTGLRSGTSPFWCFYKGKSSDRIYYSFSPDRGKTWFGNEDLENGSRTTYSPAAAYFDDKFVIVYKNENDNRLYHAYSKNGTDWKNGGTLGNGAKTRNTPSLIPFKKKLYSFYKGESSRTDIWESYSDDGKEWDGNVKIKSIDFATMSPVPVVKNRKLYVAYSKNRKVRFIYSKDGKKWHDGPRTDIKTEKNRDIAMTNLNGRVFLAYTKNDQLYLATSQDMKHWTRHGKIKNAKTDMQPTLSNNGKDIILMYKEKDGSEIRRVLYTDAHWHSDGKAIGKTKKRPFVICQ